MESVSIIVVAYGDPDGVRRCLKALGRQSRPPDEVVVVDNHPLRQGAACAREWGAVAIENDNTGFSGGCAAGAAKASGDLLLFLNPDAQPDRDCIEELCEAMKKDPEAVIAGAQVLLPGGQVNAGDNPLHPTGLSWAGNLRGQPAEGAPRRTLAVSGAAMMVRAEAFRRLGGFADRYFMYCEDTDLCWRAALTGGAVLFVPSATVVHDYEFHKGMYKWRRLEANRLRMVFANYSTQTLLLLVPLLAATELAVWAMALRGGWVKAKLGSYGDLVKEGQWLVARRRAVQKTRLVSDHTLLAAMTARLNSPELPQSLLRVVNPLLSLYVSAVTFGCSPRR